MDMDMDMDMGGERPPGARCPEGGWGGGGVGRTCSGHLALWIHEINDVHSFAPLSYLILLATKRR